MRFYVVVGILLGMVCCVFSEKITLEQVYLKDDHVTDRQKRSATMPQRLCYDMQTADGVLVRLNLTKTVQLPTTVVKGGQSSELLKSGDNMANYVDQGRDATFMIERKLDLNGQSYFHLVGVLQYGKYLVKIDPHSQGGNLYNMNNVDDIVDNRDDYVLPPGYKPAPPNYRRALDNYVVEISFLADFAIYNKFLTKNNNNEAATETEMRMYYAFHAEQLKIRYKSVNQVDPSISIVPIVKKLIIFKDAADVSFVEQDKIDATSINSKTVLYKAKDYLNAIPAGVEIPPSDHYMIFSGYELVSDSGNVNNAGLAFVGAVCNPIYAVSLVEDSQKERAAITAAHELGHGLGSNHDTLEGCNDSTQNIMTAISQTPSDTAMAKRRWLFSTCSVAAFKRTLVQKNCLHNTGTPEFTTNPKLGQIYSKDQQCEFAIGVGLGYYNTPAAEQCYRMRCITSQEPVTGGVRTSYRYILPLDYTDCGTNQWCAQGECVIIPVSERSATLPSSQVTINDFPKFTIVYRFNPPTIIYTVQAKSTNPSATLTYSLQSDLFRIDSLSGVVSVKSGVLLSNVVTGSQQTFTVTVFVSDGISTASKDLNLIVF